MVHFSVRPRIGSDHHHQHHEDSTRHFSPKKPLVSHELITRQSTTTYVHQPTNQPTISTLITAAAAPLGALHRHVRLEFGMTMIAKAHEQIV